MLKEAAGTGRYEKTVNLPGPDLLLAFTFALPGLGVGSMCGVGLAFWIAGLGPDRTPRDRVTPP